MQEGQRIREYTLKRKLGEGGMGEVWLATHGLLGQEVAVKFLDPVLARNPEVRDRFLQEAKIQASLAHPGIVRVLNALEDQGVLALIMEYVDGLSLDKVIERRGYLPLEDALRIMGQVLAAVGHAHSLGIVHRDLKPGNIMVQADGTAKVTDFGIAKILGGARLTRTGTAMGSAHYMAPEQVLGRKDIDHRVDIYALGCAFYEMLTGQPPFGHLDSPDTDSDFAVKQAHVQAPVPDPRRWRPDLPDYIVKAIMVALAKTPEERPDGCGDLLRMIDLQPSVANARLGSKRGTQSPSPATPDGQPPGNPSSSAQIVVTADIESTNRSAPTRKGRKGTIALILALSSLLANYFGPQQLWFWVLVGAIISFIISIRAITAGPQVEYMGRAIAALVVSSLVLLLFLIGFVIGAMMIANG